MLKQLTRLIVLKLPLNYDIIYLKTILINFKESVEELKKAAESVQHSYKQPAQHTSVEQKNDNQK